MLSKLPLRLLMWQDTKLAALIKQNQESGISDARLIEKLTEQAKVDEATAATYLEQWRLDPNGDYVYIMDEDEGVALPVLTTAKAKAAKGTPPTISTQAPPAVTKPAVQPVGKRVMGQLPENGNGIVAQILKLHREGKSNKEIIDAGYNRSTVSRQVGEFKKRQKGLM